MCTCATASVTVPAHRGRALATTSAILATAASCFISTSALAQPAAKKPPAKGAKAPAEPEPPPPPPGPDPETAAKLETQQAAIAAAADKLAAQQAALDDLVKQAAHLGKQLEDERAARTALGQQLDDERVAREASDKAATAAANGGVRSTWPSVALSGFLQVDGLWRQAAHDELKQNGDLLNDDRVYVRRGRPRITATYGDVSAIAEIDVNTINGGQVRPSAFEAAYQPASWLRLGAGIAKIPFGYEVLQSDKERLFLERTSTERALFPGEYDVGATVSGAWKFLRYAFAAQNGEPVGEKGYTLRDPNRAKDFTWRVGVETKVGGGDVTLAGGFSFLTGKGFHAGTPATKDVLVWRDLNEDGTVNAGEIQVIAGQAATPSASFTRNALGADAEITIDLHTRGKLMVYGELVAATNLDRANVIADPIASGRDTRELGWYVAAIHEPVPWAAVGVRYDRYDPDADASELRTGAVVPKDQARSSLAITGALKHQHGRLIVEYDHNRNHDGRSTTGVPTNLADDQVAIRGEVQW